MRQLFYYIATEFYYKMCQVIYWTVKLFIYLPIYWQFSYKMRQLLQIATTILQNVIVNTK